MMEKYSKCVLAPTQVPSMHTWKVAEKKFNEMKPMPLALLWATLYYIGVTDISRDK
jgi:hypothetical protein